MPSFYYCSRSDIQNILIRIIVCERVWKFGNVDKEISMAKWNFPGNRNIKKSSQQRENKRFHLKRDHYLNFNTAADVRTKVRYVYTSTIVKV